MTLATLVNRLIAEGTIERVRVNRYRVNSTARSRGLDITEGRVCSLSQIHALFCVRSVRGGEDYVFRSPESGFRFQAYPVSPEPERPRPVLRTITRSRYHSTGGGTSRSGIEQALRSIPMDSDGVRRSFGLEWEIYRLTEPQEDKLARLLDTLPHHVTEQDASLSSMGVEIVFAPMSASKIIDTWNKLQAFCSDEQVDMSNTGAHLTYGVSNAECDQRDLQIRINRVALAVRAVATQNSIKRLFGRDFTNYAHLPVSLTAMEHSNAWNASRGNSAYELRLCHWKGNIGKIVEFMKKTEYVFHRPFRGPDLVELYTLMGSDATGE